MRHPIHLTSFQTLKGAAAWRKPLPPKKTQPFVCLAKQVRTETYLAHSRMLIWAHAAAATQHTICGPMSYTAPSMITNGGQDGRGLPPASQTFRTSLAVGHISPYLETFVTLYRRRALIVKQRGD